MVPARAAAAALPRRAARSAALIAALAGLAVGVPSLRLRGDYLAIVTLGFGEIIRVIFQNSEAVGAASGLSGIPKLTTLGWTFGLAARHRLCRRLPGELHLRPRLHRRA